MPSLPVFAGKRANPKVRFSLNDQNASKQKSIQNFSSFEFEKKSSNFSSKMFQHKNTALLL